MGSKTILFLGLSAIFLFAIIPQAHADLCGDEVMVVVKDESGGVIFSGTEFVPYSDFFEIVPDVEASFYVGCDGDDGSIDGKSPIFWDYENPTANSINIPNHEFWFNDLQWTDGNGFVTNFQVAGFFHETPSLMTTGFNSDSAHALVGEFDIPAGVELFNDLILSASHPVGGTGIPIDITALLLASAPSISLWMIPVIIGIGVGVFVVKKRF